MERGPLEPVSPLCHPEPVEGLQTCHPEPVEGPQTCHPEPVEGPQTCHPEPVEGPQTCHPEPVEGPPSVVEAQSGLKSSGIACGASMRKRATRPSSDSNVAIVRLDASEKRPSPSGRSAVTRDAASGWPASAPGRFALNTPLSISIRIAIGRDADTNVPSNAVSCSPESSTIAGASGARSNRTAVRQAR